MQDKSIDAASWGDKLRGAAFAEVRAACSAIEGEDDVGAKIHNVRRSCKRMRGCLRLLAPALGEQYGAENAAFRDIARTLSEMRDAAVVVATFERHIESAGGADTLTGLAALKGSLSPSGRGAEPFGAKRAHKALRRVRKALAAAEGRIVQWPVADCTIDSLDLAAQRTYARARSRYLALLHRRSEVAFHEWRKECKYHWIQLGLLRDVTGTDDAGREALVHELSETLGAAHDLAVLIERLAGDEQGLAEPLAFAVRVATRKRVELEDRAIELGRMLFEAERFHGVHA